MCLLRGTDWIFIYNSTFCPHSVFMCFVWIWEQTAIISLHNINWLVFITETECVYCAVWAESLTIVQFNFKELITWVNLRKFHRISRSTSVAVCNIRFDDPSSCHSVSFTALNLSFGSKFVWNCLSLPRPLTTGLRPKLQLGNVMRSHAFPCYSQIKFSLSYFYRRLRNLHTDREKKWGRL